MASLVLAFLLALLAYAAYRLHAWQANAWGRTLLGVLLLVLALAATLVLYPSDPREWSLGRTVLYLTWPKLDLLYFLGNLLLGSLLFGLFLLGIYRARRR